MAYLRHIDEVRMHSGLPCINLRLTLIVAYQKSINNCNMQQENLKTLY